MLSGLYYPPNSLKTRMCLRGRQLLYDRCNEFNIPYRKTGKLVVAHAHQRSYIENLHAKAMALKWPLHPCRSMPDDPVLPSELLTGEQARELEPDLSPSIVAALLSPETGIVDSHALMQSLERGIKDSETGELIYSTRVVRVDPYRQSTQVQTTGVNGDEAGWVVQAATGSSDDGDAVLARTLITSTGLSGPLILNSLLPERSRIPMYYARGSYAAYSGPGISRISRLIYPCPETRGTTHSFHSLGSHLILDLQGNVRFGPDIEWLAPPPGVDVSEGQCSQGEEDTDFWEQYLAPDESRLADMHKAVTDYLPNVTLEGMRPDYVGIRPKLVGPSGGFQDFVIRVDPPTHPGVGGCGNGRNRMISLLGIESPGLTSSLAIAEYIVESILAHED
jgi:2-hydroxyglutarate dehydrogenase